MTGIILAGGKASRMGRPCDKAFLKIGNEAIINIQIRMLKKIFKEIIIVTNSSDRYKDLKGVTLVPDMISGLGPMAGIYSGLLTSSSFYNFVVACDMPFINESVIRYMIKNKDNNDVVVPKIGDKFHPLFGIYSKNCISIIAESIKQNDLSIRNIYSKVKSRFLTEHEMEEFDKGLLSLTNINIREDYEACLSGR